MSREKTRRLILFITAAFLSGLHAQTVDLSGQVFGNNGEKLEGARVQLQNTPFQNDTDPEGLFQLGGDLTGAGPVFEKAGDMSFSMTGNTLELILTSRHNVYIELIDIKGVVAYRTDASGLEAGTHQFDLSTVRSLRDGVYMLHIRTGSRDRMIRVFRHGGGWLGMATAVPPVSSALAKAAGAAETLSVDKVGYLPGRVPLRWTWGRNAAVVYEDVFKVIVLTPESGSDIWADYRQACVDKINEYRATIGMSALDRWSDAEHCIDAESRLDSESGQAHGAFGSCGEGAQDECPGWGSADQILSGCLDMMWNEGPGPAGCAEDPVCYQAHGHYLNMTNVNYTKVACGFYETSGGKVWAIQNFR